jgi:hypothetical protein
MNQSPSESNETKMLLKVPMQVMGLSIAYSVCLGWLERKFPNIKPDHIWAEVAGGVLISLVPVALEARRQRQRSQDEKDHTTDLHWKTYEGAVWRAFFASGTPIILWQIGEAVFRHMELMKYTAYGEGRSANVNAHGTETLASRGGEREGTDPASIYGSYPVPSGGSGEN